MKIGMFLGRFQPFHKGHLAACEMMLNDCERGFLVLGSANIAPEPDNPYTVFERRAMVEIALREASLLTNCEIYVIEDIPDDSKWVAYVESHVPHFTHVYSGKGLHFDLFAETHKYEMVKLSRVNEIYATKIREAVIKGEKWEDLVPDLVVREIKKMGLHRILPS